jgi:hypothetical protein
MQSSLSLQDICKKCGGYKFAPYNSNTSATVKLCHCPKMTKKELDDLALYINKCFHKDKPKDEV